jgi:hypothetical protein
VLLLFWLTFVGLIIAGRYPGGVPPAWATGRAEPWPTQQELRERRDAMRAEHRPDPEPDAEPVADDAPAPKPHPQSKKKKKKRR